MASQTRTKTYTWIKNFLFDVGWKRCVVLFKLAVTQSLHQSDYLNIHDNKELFSLGVKRTQKKFDFKILNYQKMRKNNKECLISIVT